MKMKKQYIVVSVMLLAGWFCMAGLAEAGTFLMNIEGEGAGNNHDKAINLGHTVTIDALATITAMDVSDLLAFDVIWFNPGGQTPPSPPYATLQTAVADGGSLERYVAAGGVLVICIAGDSGSQTDIAPGGVEYDQTSIHNAETFTTPAHPYLTGAGYGGSALVTTDFNNWNFTDRGWLLLLPAGATTVLNNTNGPSWVEYPWFCGTVIVNTLTYGWGAGGAVLAPQDNLIEYADFLNPIGDSDGDGVCDDVDVCAGFNDNDNFDASPPFIGELSMRAADAVPDGWLPADGQTLQCADYPVLCALLDNTYGGDLNSGTFGLPDLRGRAPMGAGAGAGLTNRTLGDEPGAESVILDVTEIPSHDHTLRATNSFATATQPEGNILALAPPSQPLYRDDTTSVDMGSDSIGSVGGDGPHSNVQASTVMNFVIAAAGHSGGINPANIVGDMRMTAADVTGFPVGWLLADGTVYNCSDFPALCDVLGDTFGGDLNSGTFGVPDLRGRFPMGTGAGPGLPNRNLGDEPGAESVTLDVTELPSHDHTLRATNTSATATQPAGNILATAPSQPPLYRNDTTSVGMGSDSIGSAGGGAPHANVQSASVVNFMIHAGDAFSQDNLNNAVPLAHFVGETRLLAASGAPTGWLIADGSVQLCDDFPTLCNVLGNTYGGNLGSGTFGIPDFRGRIPMGDGAGAGLTNRTLGDEHGAESVILDVTEIPSHNHTLRATNSSGTQTQPSALILATAATPQYLTATTSVVMGSDSIGSTGSNAPHANVAPSSVLNVMIASTAFDIDGDGIPLPCDLCPAILRGDFNDDCINDLIDFAAYSQTWLVDCIATPADPACGTN